MSADRGGDERARYLAAAAGTSVYVWLAPHREHLKSIDGMSCGSAWTCSSVGLCSAGTSWKICRAPQCVHV
jgi:hypothetical protein